MDILHLEQLGGDRFGNTGCFRLQRRIASDAPCSGNIATNLSAAVGGAPGWRPVIVMWMGDRPRIRSRMGRIAIATPARSTRLVTANSHFG